MSNYFSPKCPLLIDMNQLPKKEILLLGVLGVKRD